MKHRVILLTVTLTFLFSSGAFGQESTGTPLTAVRDYVGISAWHTAGFDGSGAKVGIIDLGFAGIDIISDDFILPDSAIVDRVFNAPSHHGTMVYEVLHAMAPGATYYLFQLNPGGKNVAEAVDWLLEMDVDVVNFSISSVDIPLDGNNYQAQQMHRLIDNDVLVTTSVGNFVITFIHYTFLH